MPVTTVRLSDDIRYKIKIAAAQEEVTMEEFVARACLHYLYYLQHKTRSADGADPPMTEAAS